MENKGDDIDEIKEAQKLMKKTIDLFKDQLFGLEDNVNDDLIATVKVKYNGQLTPLEHLGLVDQQDRRVSITPYDPTLMGVIETELKKQGFNAYKFSKKTIVVNIPLPSGENRNKVIAQMKKLAEEAKVSLRNIRKKFRKKKDDESYDKQLQKITDVAVKKIGDMI